MTVNLFSSQFACELNCWYVNWVTIPFKIEYSPFLGSFWSFWKKFSDLEERKSLRILRVIFIFRLTFLSQFQFHFLFYFHYKDNFILKSIIVWSKCTDINWIKVFMVYLFWSILLSLSLRIIMMKNTFVESLKVDGVWWREGEWLNKIVEIKCNPTFKFIYYHKKRTNYNEKETWTVTRRQFT